MFVLCQNCLLYTERKDLGLLCSMILLGRMYYTASKLRISLFYCIKFTAYCFTLGTPYEMGYAQGTLLKKEASQFMNEVWEYLEDQVVRNSFI